jgi:hypothetical protein
LLNAKDPKSEDAELVNLPNAGSERVEAELLTLLNAGLERFDAEYPVAAPDVWSLQQELALHKQAIRRKRKRDLLLFLLAAASLALGTVALFLFRPGAFLAFEAVTVMAPVLVLTFLVIKERAERQVDR